MTVCHDTLEGLVVLIDTLICKINAKGCFPIKTLQT